MMVELRTEYSGQPTLKVLELRCRFDGWVGGRCVRVVFLPFQELELELELGLDQDLARLNEWLDLYRESL